MLKCGCGGLLIPVAIEEYPSNLSGKEKLHYERVCDVECQECGKIYYSQPYESHGQQLSAVKESKPL